MYFQQDMASVTLHYAVDYTLMWSPAAAGGTGTYPGYVVRRDFNASPGTMYFSSTGPSLASFDDKLDTIIESIQTLFDRFKGFNTDDALYCFDSFHYDGNTSDTYPGMIASNGSLVILRTLPVVTLILLFLLVVMPYLLILTVLILCLLLAGASC